MEITFNNFKLVIGYLRRHAELIKRHAESINSTSTYYINAIIKGNPITIQLVDNMLGFSYLSSDYMFVLSNEELEYFKTFVEETKSTLDISNFSKLINDVND